MQEVISLKKNIYIAFFLCRQGTLGIARRCRLCHGGSLWVEQSDHMCPQPVRRRPTMGRPVWGDDYQECQQGPHLQAVLCAGQLLCQHFIIAHLKDIYLFRKLLCSSLVFIRLILYHMIISANFYFYFYRLYDSNFSRVQCSQNQR